MSAITIAEPAPATAQVNGLSTSLPPRIAWYVPAAAVTTESMWNVRHTPWLRYLRNSDVTSTSTSAYMAMIPHAAASEFQVDSPGMKSSRGPKSTKESRYKVPM